MHERRRRPELRATGRPAGERGDPAGWPPADQAGNNDELVQQKGKMALKRK